VASKYQLKTHPLPLLGSALVDGYGADSGSKME
jgi:hypothetical protein